MVSIHNLSFLFTIFILISLTNVKADLVDDVCAKTLQPALCSKLIRSNPGSKTPDLVALGFVTIDVTEKQAKSGKTLVQTLLKGASNPIFKEIYSSCLENYGDSVDDIGKLAGFLRNKDYGSLGSYASAAADGATTCDDNFSNASPEPSQLKDASAKLRTLCSAVLVINNKLKGN